MTGTHVSRGISLSIRLVIAIIAGSAMMAVAALLLSGISAALLVAGAGLLILLLTYGLVLRRLKPEMEVHAVQLAQQQSLLVTQLRETAAQEERNRLARDLHDTIKQQLFSINVAAATAQSLRERDPEAAAEHIQEVRQLAQAAMVEMKALLTQLRPQPLAAVGLAQAVRDQLDALHFRSEVAVELRCESLPDESRLPLGAQEAVFRVAQEALANIARHARASHVAVHITHDAKALSVRICDDGQGFDPANVRKGMGLNNMRARITELGGHFQVRSSPGAGSEIAFDVPLARAQPLVDTSLVERRYKLNQLSATALAATGVLVTFALTAGQAAMTVTPGTAGNRSVLWLGLIGIGILISLAVAVISYIRLHVILPEGFQLRKIVLGGVLSAASAAVLIGAYMAFNASYYTLAVVCSLAAILLAVGGVVINERIFAGTLHEWTTVEKERAVARSWQWLMPLFVLMQVFWLVMQAPFDTVTFQFTQPPDVVLARYLQANAFWWLWLVIVVGFSLTSQQRIRQLEQEGVQVLVAALPPTAHSAAPMALRRRRLPAAVLTVGYLLIALPLAGAALFTDRTLIAALLGLLCLVLLFAKWRVEQGLTQIAEQWTTLAAQKGVLAVYQLAGVMSVTMTVSGLIGGLLGGLGQLGELGGNGILLFTPQMAAVNPPLGILGVLTAWVLGVSPYTVIMWVVTRRRVRRLASLSHMAAVGNTNGYTG